MATIQRTPQPVFTASPPSVQPSSTERPSATGRSLPDKDVADAASIEDAYVAFILYCNPAVPLETDTTALREAFRIPPKSGGKSFSTYVLFELIKKLETKELKTWAELALKLGVEPPDQEKGESAQKIQQYAVRLKRWMHAMHVDAFFEYLIGRESPYWTEIPAEHIPVAELERDGVAAEDDMALRALLPQIKPRRGRRKAEDDETNKSPPRRPSPQADEYGGGRRQDVTEPWTAQPDGRGSVFLFPPVSDPSRLNPSAPSWGNNDMVQTPMTAYPVPQSAITPSTRNAFWADEPKSATTLSKPRSASRRHGAKVVSSAWRSGGVGTSGKTRGRPPINRGANNEGPFSAFPTSETPTFRFPSPPPRGRNVAPNGSLTAPSTNPSPVPTMTPPGPLPPRAPPAQPAQNPSNLSPIHESAPPRPAKRSRLSLQVPERVGGEVRLATPPLPDPAAPPVVMVNGQTPSTQPAPATEGSLPPPPCTTTGGGIFPPAFLPPGIVAVVQRPSFSQDPTDRTHMDELEAHFISSILQADWYDAAQNRIPTCGVDEAWALYRRVVENLLASAPTKEAFLINLAALAGGSILMTKGSLRITRVEEGADRTRYECRWQLRFGDVKGDWAMEETVSHGRWKKAAREEQGAGADVVVNGTEEGYWERKYKELAATSRRREEEMLKLKARVIESIKESRPP
ncbi:hypothetical protein VTI74DRAFT_6858 [Chaetomium olivicolor]